MYELVFNTKLTKDGNLECPKELCLEKATYKVIVNFDNIDYEIYNSELSSITDNSSEFLTKEEINYYLNLV